MQRINISPGKARIFDPGISKFNHGKRLHSLCIVHDADRSQEMISDLKADSARWEAEASRRQHAGYAPGKSKSA